MSHDDDPDAEARRLARSRAEVRVFGPGEEEAEADADALWWDRIPIDERAEFVWKLSVELFRLAEVNRRDESGLPRSSSGPHRG
jgi:hypothetical protein